MFFVCFTSSDGLSKKKPKKEKNGKGLYERARALIISGTYGNTFMCNDE